MNSQVLPESRTAAFSQGLRKYFTGKACINGHVEARYTATGACLGCLREAATRHRRAFNVSAFAKLEGSQLFSYKLHPDDLPALLAYAQSLDLARGRVPAETGNALGVDRGHNAAEGLDPVEEGRKAYETIHGKARDIKAMSPVASYPMQTKEMARMMNEETYFGGRICNHGHTAPRYVANDKCTACEELKGMK